MGGEALWQNDKYVAPARLRSKKYESFQKKRHDKLLAKKYKEAIINEGEDPDAYLDQAFSAGS